jgi:hypothetical protein
MQHPINENVRLASPVKRNYCRLFVPSSPLGWVDYHVVEERRGTLWVHCHGLRRRKGFDLEFVGVPTALRREAVRLMMGIIRIERDSAKFAPDTDFGGRFSSSQQSFSQAATFRGSPCNDPDHERFLRIVDFGEPMQSGFPARLFAAHLVARGQAQTDAKAAEKLFRRAIELFPGDTVLTTAVADYDPADGDITALQAKSNLGAWLGLALALRGRGCTGTISSAPIPGTTPIRISGEILTCWRSRCAGRSPRRLGPGRVGPSTSEADLAAGSARCVGYRRPLFLRRRVILAVGSQEFLAVVAIEALGARIAQDGQHLRDLVGLLLQPGDNLRRADLVQ